MIQIRTWIRSILTIAQLVSSAGSLRAGHRAAAVMSLIQSASLEGHEPNRYLKDVLQRPPTQRASQIEELLPHRWAPTEVS